MIILDEVHYLSDISRGTVWEEIVCTFCSSVFLFATLTKNKIVDRNH